MQLPQTFAISPNTRQRLARVDWNAVLFHAAVWVLLVDFVFAAVMQGLQLRRNLWEQTHTIRFEGDIRNAYHWGYLAAVFERIDERTPGWIQLYDRLLAGRFGGRAEFGGFDYPPLRLAIVTNWVQWTQRHWPNTEEWRREYEFSRPMLWLNNVAELIAAVAVFCIVRQWRRRSAPRYAARPYRGVIPGLLAATLLWFNPAVLWDAHVWPQWDMWILPFFLWAVFLASNRWWFSAGVLLGVGTLIKGQILWAAPVFLLWPIFALDFRAFFRVACGFAFAVAISTWPFLVRSDETRQWVRNVMIAGALLAIPLLLRRRAGLLNPLRARLAGSEPAESTTASADCSKTPPDGNLADVYASLRDHAVWIYLAMSAIVLLLVVQPFFRLPINWSIQALLLIVASLAAIWVLPRRDAPYFLAAGMAAAIFLGGVYKGGSFGWYEVGFRYGAEKYQNEMFTSGTSNLCTLLERVYGWRHPHEMVAIEMPLVDLPQWLNVLGWFGYAAPFHMELRTVLAGIFIVALIICAWGAAVHHRRKDPRFLIAVCAPFVLFFTLMPQMHDRYLIWGAAASAIFVAVGAGPTLLHLLISGFCWMMIAWNTFRADSRWHVELVRFVRSAHTDIAWPVLLIALILLYLASPWPLRRRRKVEPPITA